MEMVRVGGHLTQVNVANNFTGHGFWQFSPELIYSLFSAANGFETVTVLMHEVQPGGAWYVVADPERVGRRVELCNAAPTYILTIAKRVAAAHVLASPPQQSDYVPKWIDAETTAQPPELPNHPFPEPLYHRIAEDDLLAGNLPKMAYTDPD